MGQKIMLGLVMLGAFTITVGIAKTVPDIKPFEKGEVVTTSKFNFLLYKVNDLERKVKGLQLQVNKLNSKTEEASDSTDRPANTRQRIENVYLIMPQDNESSLFGPFTETKNQNEKTSHYIAL